MRSRKKSANVIKNNSEKNYSKLIKNKQYKEIKIEKPQIVRLYIEDFSMKIDTVMRSFSLIL
jgi:hypothetical protein